MRAILIKSLVFFTLFTLSIGGAGVLAAAWYKNEITVENYLDRRLVSLEPMWQVLRGQAGQVLTTEADPERCGLLSVTWDPVARAEEYELYRDGQLVYKGGNTAFTDRVVFGRWYNYRIRAANSAGSYSSEYRKLRSTVRCAPQEAPARVEVLPVTCGGNVRLTWSQVPEAQTYRVEKPGQSSFFFAAPPWQRGGRSVDQPGDGQVIYEGSNTEFTERDLDPGQSYTYVIWAGNETGYSEQKREIKVTASSQCPPERPGPPRADR